jgi:hypothetical protein
MSNDKTTGDRYGAWIAAHGYGRGQCAEATEAMVAAFPELQRVRGHVVLLGRAKRPTHWWCITPDGAIVDPTRSQFPGLVGYDEWTEGAEEPVGRCCNCSEYIYPSSGYTDTVCSDACARAYEAYCMGAFR